MKNSQFVCVSPQPPTPPMGNGERFPCVSERGSDTHDANRTTEGAVPTREDTLPRTGNPAGAQMPRKFPARPAEPESRVTFAPADPWRAVPAGTDPSRVVVLTLVAGSASPVWRQLAKPVKWVLRSAGFELIDHQQPREVSK